MVSQAGASVCKHRQCLAPSRQATVEAGMAELCLQSSSEQCQAGLPLGMGKAVVQDAQNDLILSLLNQIS